MFHNHSNFVSPNPLIRNRQLKRYYISTISYAPKNRLFFRI